MSNVFRRAAAPQRSEARVAVVGSHSCLVLGDRSASLGVNVSGRHRVHTNTISGKFQRHPLRQGDLPCLGSAIETSKFLGGISTDGGYVYDVPAPAGGDHPLSNSLRAVK